MSVASAVGLVSGVMGIWSFVSEQVPSQEEDQSKYRVFVGLNGHRGLSAAEGEIGLVKLYNKNHDLMGSGMGGLIGFNNKQYGEFGIPQDGTQQSIWTEFCECRASVSLDNPLTKLLISAYLSCRG